MRSAVADTGWDSFPLVAVPLAVGVPVMVFPDTVAAIVSEGDARLQGSEPQPTSTPREMVSGVHPSTVAFTVVPLTEPRNWQVIPLIVTDVLGRVLPLCVSGTVALRVMLLRRARATLPAQPPPWMSSVDAVTTAVQVPETSAGVVVSGAVDVGLVGEKRLNGERPPASHPVSNRAQSADAQSRSPKSSLPCRPGRPLHGSLGRWRRDL